jgi:hypothetical protein
MLNKNLLLKVSSLLVVGLMVAAPAFAKSPKESKDEGRLEDSTEQSAVWGTANTGALALPASGMGSINLINYDGGGEQLTVDFNGIDYVVPASPLGGSGIWNHAEFSLAPGTYNWTASVMGNDSVVNGTINVVAGKVTSIGFYDNPADASFTSEDKSDDQEATGDRAKIESTSSDNANDSQRDRDDLLFSVSDMTSLAH